MKLKHFRIFLAIIAFSLLTLLFIDFANKSTDHLFRLAHIQFVPALLSGMFIVVAFWLILTLLFGRVYCSMICPLGIFQDIITWIRKRFRPKMKQSFSKEKKVLRFSVLIVVVGSYLAGITSILSLLDPYSAYGRIATHLFRPAYMAGNNVLAAAFNHFENYTFYHVDIYTLSFVSLLIALLTFLVIGALAALYGRTWCNTICPVGTVLGYVSKLSLFKVRFDEQSCISCGLCEKACKASCIDSHNKTVDYSRCVACYDCLTTCKRHSLSYKLPAKKQAVPEQENVDQSKRRFFGAMAVAAVAVPTTLMAKNLSLPSSKKTINKKEPLSPPGSISHKHLLETCTACHLCVSKCPSRILKPALLEYGAAGIMLPRMDFEHGFCNADCTMCSDVCPTDALVKLTKKEKNTLQMGRVVFIKTNCVVYNDETSCGACSEHCRTQAVSMVPYKGVLTIPSINPDICVGCGGCEYVCPATPKAIYVEGNPVHRKAKAFQDADATEAAPDSFGF